MVWGESVASQDLAQEIQIRHSIDYSLTNSCGFILVPRCNTDPHPVTNKKTFNRKNNLSRSKKLRFIRVKISYEKDS
jgi:hypothetical protein